MSSPEPPFRRGPRRLRVWQRAMDLALAVFHACEPMALRHQIALGHQMRRAAVSIASNIAEGQSSSSARHQYHYLSVALGSANELETQIELCVQLKLLPPETSVRLFALLSDTGRMLTIMRRKTREKFSRQDRSPSV